MVVSGLPLERRGSGTPQTGHVPSPESPGHASGESRHSRGSLSLDLDCSQGCKRRWLQARVPPGWISCAYRAAYADTRCTGLVHPR
jgi:hypothetical protein